MIAPALIPRRPGDRIKTDRRDAAQLAVLFRAGALTAIHIPTEQEEAARDLLRCREDIRADLLRARHRLSKFLLRHGRRFTVTKKAWSKRHEGWLRAQTWPLPALAQTHRAYLRTVDEAVARLRAVEEDLRAVLAILEPLRPRIQRLRCFRGMDDLTALTIAPSSAMRGGSPPRRSLMAFVGLDSLGALERDETRPRRDHEDRQRPPPARPDRSRLALPPPSVRGRHLAGAPTGSATDGHRARLDGAAAAASSLPAVGRRGGNPNRRSSRRSPASSRALSGRR